MEQQHQIHTISPVYNEHSRILILGSFPSVKSREAGFFYGHPQNRFWKVLANVFQAEVPGTIEEKKAFLLEHRIAVWDVIGQCEITGSSDSSIRNVVPNPISKILETTKIEQIFVNGKKAEQLYQRYIYPQTKNTVYIRNIVKKRREKRRRSCPLPVRQMQAGTSRS